jgi:hypothetical protein
VTLPEIAMRKSIRGLSNMIVAVFLTALPLTPVSSAEAPNPATDELRTAIAAGKYDDLAGTYQMGLYQIVTVSRDGRQLFAQVGSDGQYLDMVPLAAHQFSVPTDAA